MYNLLMRSNTCTLEKENHQQFRQHSTTAHGANPLDSSLSDALLFLTFSLFPSVFLSFSLSLLFFYVLSFLYIFYLYFSLSVFLLLSFTWSLYLSESFSPISRFLHLCSYSFSLPFPFFSLPLPFFLLFLSLCFSISTHFLSYSISLSFSHSL